jgi:hypothetical protein
MASSLDVVRVILASDVATAGTFTVSYPTNRDAGDYSGGTEHEVVSRTYGRLTAKSGKVSFAFGASNITVTNSTGSTMLAGTDLNVQLDRLGQESRIRKLADGGASMAPAMGYLINLGAPDTADADGYVVSQDLTAAGVFSVSTTAAAAIAAAALAGTADVPRNVVAGWTGTAVITITGTDEYGNVVKESSASGTSLAGKKAFKTVTGISVSANVTSLTVGTGDVLGLPVFLPLKGLVYREMEDGALATAGTTLAGVTTLATATTGDVRGTYDPNSACNGSKAFQLLVALPDPSDRGVAQYAG